MLGQHTQDRKSIAVQQGPRVATQDKQPYYRKNSLSLANHAAVIQPAPLSPIP